jgi:cysteinyl-tRNA synthetase
MVLMLYNTMSREKEIFTPLHGNKVYMFVCGPTTYDFSHLGHARTYVAYDIVARYLRYKGYTLFYIMNITDVDDKIISRAKETGTDPLKLASEYEKYFYEDMAALGVNCVNLYARASEHIQEIINQARILIERGYAYETGTGVYYDTTKFRDLGALSHQNLTELKKHRIEPDPTKKNPQDFALWKKRSSDEPGWDSPWGNGRPGWHIEDTAITTHYFGPQYDIHGGAVELIFPHHEAEIAQAEAATGIKPFVKYWVHTGVLQVDGKKMSKSLGNFITVRDVLKKYEPEVLRLFFASTHYRSVIDFREGSLEQAKQALKSIYNTLDNVKRLSPKEGIEEDEKELEKTLEECRGRFVKAMDNDFYTPIALAALFNMANEANKFVDSHRAMNVNLQRRILEIFKELGGILGILQKERKEIGVEVLNNLLTLIVELRQKFRENKDWQTADIIRSKLADWGITLEDKEDGTMWKIS